MAGAEQDSWLDEQRVDIAEQLIAAARNRISGRVALEGNFTDQRTGRFNIVSPVAGTCPVEIEFDYAFWMVRIGNLRSSEWVGDYDEAGLRMALELFDAAVAGLVVESTSLGYAKSEVTLDDGDVAIGWFCPPWHPKSLIPWLRWRRVATFGPVV